MTDRIGALTCPFDRRDSVELILQRFTKLADCFADRHDTRIHLPFLNAYQRSSRCLLELTDHADVPTAPLRQLAIEFANRYLRAAHHGLVAGQPEPPWRTYFDYTQCGGRKPLAALVLGVKSHVSGDLPSTLRATGIRNHHAFCAFDTSLRALSPEAVKAALAYGGAAKISSMMTHPDLIRPAYDLSVRRWRARAWAERDPHGAAERSERSCRRLVAVLDPLWWIRHRFT